MQRPIHEQPARVTPPEVVKTVKILAPKGSTIEQTIAAMGLAASLHTAKKERRKLEEPK